MMNEIISNNERVRRIESPYNNLQHQFDHSKDVQDLLWCTKGILEFNLFQLIPKVTYDDWMVCLYLLDNKLYYITEEDITEVEVIEVLECYEDGNVITPYGVLTDEDDILDYVKDYLCCGEADDMSCYAYFEVKHIGKTNEEE